MRNELRIRSEERAFTLIELMLVIVIIGVLVAAVVPRLTGRTEEARITRAKSDIESISLAIDMYEVDNGEFPPNIEALRSKPGDAENWRGPYLKREPLDPWGKQYKYKNPGDHNKEDYDLYSNGKDGAEGADDVTNWD